MTKIEPNHHTPFKVKSIRDREPISTSVIVNESVIYTTDFCQRFRVTFNKNE